MAVVLNGEVLYKATRTQEQTTTKRIYKIHYNIWKIPFQYLEDLCFKSG